MEEGDPNATHKTHRICSSRARPPRTAARGPSIGAAAEIALPLCYHSVRGGGGGGGRKGQGEGLGRALVRQRNKAAAAAKERGHALALARRARQPLESVIEVSDIDAVLQRAAEADLLLADGDDDAHETLSAAPGSGLIDLDGAVETEERRWMREEQEALHAGSLKVPRRPPWSPQMTVEELDANERRAFLEWRRNLARLEENEKLVLTPFEKNIDIWRQLWRVLERSDLLVMVVDARDPLFYRCPDLEVYAQEIDEHKRTLLLVNKADLLPLNVRQRWAEYFKQHDILYLFWSAKAATADLEGKKLSSYSMEDWNTPDLDTKIYGRVELLDEEISQADPNISHVLSDLESFDLGSGVSKNSTKKKEPSYKHHKKPQRKKDRSWRVGNDDADGSGVVRVFQKPAVNFATVTG
uniref:CP-type G domain-containing protein n=1 Tax=Leersia perrieri TaxID=77586 RepID=A0A0D9VWW5_9ORYZ